MKRVLFSLLLLWWCSILEIPLSIAQGVPSVENSFEEIYSSDAFLKLPFPERLAIVDGHFALLPIDASDREWAQIARQKLHILARLGDFEKSKNFLDEHLDRLIIGLEGYEGYALMLYHGGFVYAYTGEMEKSLELIERLKKISDFEANYTYQQYVDTLLVALHTQSGNAILAADILIENLEDGSAAKLPPLDRLKVTVNTIYALIEGGDFVRAEKYLRLSDEEFKQASEQNLISEFQLNQLKTHIHSNTSTYLIKQKRYNEIGIFLSDFEQKANEIGAPVLIAQAMYAKAAFALGKSDLKTARENINQSITIVEKLGINDVLINLYDIQAEIFSSAGEFENAFASYESQKLIVTSMNRQQSRARADFLQARLLLQEQNARIERLESENRSAELLVARDRFVVMFSLIALLSVGMFALGLFRSRLRLKTYSSELELSEKKAKAATLAKSAFLANMSHEIRTPLNGLMGMTQILSEKDLSPELKKCVDIITSSSVSLMAIVNDVLDISKIEAGKMTIEYIPTDIRNLLDQMHHIWNTKAEEKQIGLDFSVSDEVPNILECDPVRLRQCISNLVSNAIKFTEIGEVHLNIDVDEEETGEQYLMIVVRDTGIGISSDVSERLFSSFEQGDTSTTRRFGGTGLGLAITSELAELMGGDICVQSKLGDGAEFLLRVPLVEQSKENVVLMADHTSRDLPLKNIMSGESITILIVDDNPVNRLVAKAFVEKPGVLVIEAENGKLALERLYDTSAIDLVLLDMHMPVMAGPETIRRIRESGEKWDCVPVITLTADAMQGDRAKYIALGTNGYVAKPLIRSELEGEIQRVMTEISAKNCARFNDKELSITASW